MLLKVADARACCARVKQASDMQVAVGDMWSSEDGECFDDTNAQVWQVPLRQ